MDSKTLSVLEYDKILERLAAHCDFSASKELARALQPTADMDETRRRLAETSEARDLLSTRDLTVGGARDIRPQADLAARRGVLEPAELLDVKATLISCRDLKKSLEKLADEYPNLSEIAGRLPDTYGIVDAITRAISDRGEVLDSASATLASIRAQSRVAHERLMSKLQKYLSDSRTAPLLQETLITQRDGRFVIPLRAEFKGRIKAIVHDQSLSGATLFVEPLAVVELNNEYRELQLAERDEERRVLAELSAQVGEHAAEIIPGIEALAELDLAFAKAKYAEEIEASEPMLSEPVTSEQSSVAGEQSKIENQKSSIRLLRARHPLLDPAAVVPIDVVLEPGVFVMVITGPNTGGKTVTLKTVGLLALMAQSGLHIPARSGSELPCYRAVWADIGDEQSIEQSLSTFSGHMTNIIRLLKGADHRDLVVLDELGAGTDPQEGSALARAILGYLLERGITAFVATHYPELKTFAHSTPGVVNASLEFDIKTLRPTYRLTIGLPGRSNALAIARRLGLPEAIVAAARRAIHPDELRADRLLDDIRRERNRAAREREQAEAARARGEQLTRELEKRLEAIEEQRRRVLQEARAEGELEVAVLKRNIETLRRELQKARQPLEAVKALEKQVEALEAEVEQPVERRGDQLPLIGDQSLRLGERVRVSGLNAEGVVTALGESEAEIQVGSLRLRAKLVDLERKSSDQVSVISGQSPPAAQYASSPGLEISLRGQMVDDALETLDRYIDQAYLAGLPFVRIIHGKGTGRLRQAVREALKQNPHVASFEEGSEKEGGAGVTVAMLRG